MIDWMDIIAKPRALAQRRWEHKREWRPGDVYHRTVKGAGLVGRVLRRNRGS